MELRWAAAPDQIVDLWSTWPYPLWSVVTGTKYYAALRPVQGKQNKGSGDDKKDETNEISGFGLRSTGAAFPSELTGREPYVPLAFAGVHGFI